MDVIGTLGMILLLGAFLANATGRLAADGMLYHLLNALGASTLAWYSVQLGVWVFAVLESVWAVAALGNLARALARRKRD